MDGHQSNSLHPVSVTVRTLMAHRLEDECPWETCAKVWTHASWVDLLETIETLSPDAYAALRRDLLKERT